MNTALVGGTLVTPDVILPDHAITIADGRITSLTADLPPVGDTVVIDAQGGWVIPGLIDVHVHGGDGYDTMDATPEALHGLARFLARHGVTGFLPTTMTASADAIGAAIEAYQATPSTPDGAQRLGLHLEGPYLSYEQRGAQPAEHLRNPDPSEYASWLASGEVRLITLAPELEGALALIDQATAAGAAIAVGHTAADYEQTLTAFDRGARQATHIFSGMPPFSHRAPGVLGACLSDDRLVAQAIVDGVHIHPAMVRLLVRAKGVERLILISDSIRAAGLGDGTYDLGGQPVVVRDGVTRRAYDGGLAGSTLTLDAALRNVMVFAGLSLAEALPMATRVPAAALGLAGRKGVIAPGADADLVVLDSEYRVRLTLVAGRVVYRTGDNR